MVDEDKDAQIVVNRVGITKKKAMLGALNLTVPKGLRSGRITTDTSPNLGWASPRVPEPGKAKRRHSEE